MLAQLAFVLVLGSQLDRPVADSVRSDRDVRLAALRHVADVKRCYEREGLTRDPRLTGTLDVTVTVLATGVVSDAYSPARAARTSRAAAESAGLLLTTTATPSSREKAGRVAGAVAVVNGRWTPSREAG